MNKFTIFIEFNYAQPINMRCGYGYVENDSYLVRRREKANATITTSVTLDKEQKYTTHTHMYVK